MRLLGIALTVALAAPAADLRVGAAAVKITPPRGAPMAGYYYNRAADGVHDDLYAKALVLASNGERAAMVSCASPFQYTIIAELANGSVGYVPNRKAYPEGAYEPESARCAAGSGEMLVDAATRLLVALRNQKAAD